MKRSILILLVSGLLVIPCFSQTKTFTRQYSGTVKYQKTKQPCTIFEFPYPASETEDGILAFFTEQGSKPKESKGFYYAQNVRVTKDAVKFHDVYYKVEKNGRDGSKVYAILTELGETPLERTSNHNVLAAGVAGAGVMAAMGPALGEHDEKVQLRRQEENIKKSEKSLNDLMNESKQLEKKRASLENDINNNKLSQQKVQQDLEAKKQLYQQMIEKGKKN